MPYISLQDQGFFQPGQQIADGMNGFSQMYQIFRPKGVLSQQDQQFDQNALNLQKLKVDTNTAIKGRQVNPNAILDDAMQQMNGAPSAAPAAPVTPPVTIFPPATGSKFSGPLAGKENDIAISAYDHGVDPKLMGGIVAEETGWGKSKALRDNNNPGGLMDGKTKANTGFQSFPTVDAGLDAMAGNLKKNYIDQGLNTPETIGAKYSPPGAANDPNGTNAGWPKDVSRLMTQANVPDVRRALPVPFPHYMGDRDGGSSLPLAMAPTISPPPAIAQGQPDEVPPVTQPVAPPTEVAHSGRIGGVVGLPPTITPPAMQTAGIAPSLDAIKAGLQGAGKVLDPNDFGAATKAAMTPGLPRWAGIPAAVSGVAGDAMLAPAKMAWNAGKWLTEPMVPSTVPKQGAPPTASSKAPVAAAKTADAMSPAPAKGETPKTETPEDLTAPEETPVSTKGAPVPNVGDEGYSPESPDYQPKPGEPAAAAPAAQPLKQGEAYLFRNLPPEIQSGIVTKYGGDAKLAASEIDNAVRTRYGDANLGMPSASAQPGEQITTGPNGELVEKKTSWSPFVEAMKGNKSAQGVMSSMMAPSIVREPNTGAGIAMRTFDPLKGEYHYTEIPKELRESGRGLNEGQLETIHGLSKELYSSDAGREFAMSKAYLDAAHANIASRPEKFNTNDHVLDAELLDYAAKQVSPTQALRMGNVQLTLEGESAGQWLTKKMAHLGSENGAILTPSERKSVMKVIDQTAKAKADGFKTLAEPFVSRGLAVARQYDPNAKVDENFVRTVLTGYPSGDPTEAMKRGTKNISGGATPSNVTPEELSGAKAFIQQNPNDPKAIELKQKLGL